MTVTPLAPRHFVAEALRAGENADLWFPGQQDPVGVLPGRNGRSYRWPEGADRLRYVVWVDTGRPHGPLTRPELAPRQALHLVACRNGHEAT